MKYSILDPTGNITALAESFVALPDQPAAAAAILRRHPEVEQVGFLRPTEEPGVRAELRMSGGEFCGNACMCAAALLSAASATAEEGITVRLRVSGAAEPVATWLRREADRRYSAAVQMPPSLEITKQVFAFGELRGRLPLVRMEGISHAILEPGSVFFRLLKDRGLAEQALRAFCEAICADCAGFLFLEWDTLGWRMTPLVYVPGSGTMFWEGSCASGTAAAAMLLAKRAGQPVALSVSEPDGVLRAESGPDGTRLYGTVSLRGQYEL